MYTIILCEDEPGTAGLLEQKINETMGNICHIRGFSSYFALESYIFDVSKGSVDILFLEIERHKDSGIELAKRIKEKYPHIKTIFVSQRTEYALDVFDAMPLYFLAKPVDGKKLEAALSLAVSALEVDSSDCFTLCHNGEIARLRYGAIHYFESNKRIVSVHCSSGIVEIRGKLTELESKLPESFFKCHQSYIVNLDRVQSLKGGCFILASGESVPVSRQKLALAKDRLTGRNGK